MMRIPMCEKRKKRVRTYLRLVVNGPATTLASSKEQMGQRSGRRKNGARVGAREKI